MAEFTFDLLTCKTKEISKFDGFKRAEDCGGKATRVNCNRRTKFVEFRSIRNRSVEY